MVQAVGMPSLVVFTPVQPISPVGPAVAEALAQQPKTPQQTPQQAAVAQAAASAAGRQGGLGPLMADLAQAVETPALPPQVRAAAAQVLALQAPLTDTVRPAVVRQAVAQSGVFLEARLAAAPETPPGPDIKAALLVLRQALAATSAPAPAAQPPSTAQAMAKPVQTPLPPLPAGAAGAPAPAVPSQLAQAAAAPPPPYRGAPTKGQRPAAASLPTGAAPAAVAGRLARQTEAALAREELLQLASLPEPGPQAEAAETDQARWMFEIPFATPQGSAVAQFEVSRDGRNPSDPGDPQQPVWRVRFSLDVEPSGPVHAAVTLANDRASVVLWAERGDVAERLRAGTEGLAQALRGTAAAEAEVAVYAGAPPHAAPSPGRLVDQAS